MAKRFYNPGAKFKELLRFDNPINEIKQQNLVSFWPIEAEEESFFEVPTELTFNLAGGEEVSVPEAGQDGLCAAWSRPGRSEC